MILQRLQQLMHFRKLRLRNEAMIILLVFVLIYWRLMVLVVPPEMFADEHAKHALPGQRIIMVSYIFGTSNAYVQLFAESARRSGVDVAIVGSPKPAFPLPPNVRHFPITWDQFVDRVSTRVFHGEDLPALRKAKPYKINDFKGLFAYLFPEIVAGYDFWGHLDNDIVLGNVRHFVTPEILADHDVISPLDPPDKKKHYLRTWGAFTLYRNTNVTNELFFHSWLPLNETLGSGTALHLDEWGANGGVKGRWWNSSMSGILTNHRERLGIRVWQGVFPMGWDGTCKPGEARCVECTLTLPPRSGSHQMLTTNKTKCTPSSEEDCQEEVMLCHYYLGKHNIEASLANVDLQQYLAREGRIRVSFHEGFTPFPRSESQ